MDTIARIAVVNRGEPAMRLIHAVAEYNRERGTSIETVALFTEPDRQALFTRRADLARSLGPAMTVDADGRAVSAYVERDLLLGAIRDAGADAVWVGWGFVAEDPEFAALCEEHGITFIGPTAATMRRLGDKITSKRLVEEAGVPVTPWSGGPVTDLTAAAEAADRLGYPLLVKASAGGGGRGIRRVRDPESLPAAIRSAREEARAAFGDDRVYLEAMMTGARHVEVQIIGDRYGTVWALGVRDCSLQRRNQKIIEETPSPGLDAATDAALRDAAVRIGTASDYHGAGTVEFLYDVKERDFRFMEVNTRLQVEHPVTEAVTGVDLVKLQIDVAAGVRLDGEPPPPAGHAIEARLNAEDPASGFAPAPGTIEVLRLPSGPGVRVDTGVEEGDTIPAEFDSMIAKIIAHGRTRAEAVGRLRRALDQMSVMIRGGTTNRSFLHRLLAHDSVLAGEFDIGFVDRMVEAGEHQTNRAAPVALVSSAVAAYEEAIGVDVTAFEASASRGRPTVEHEIGRTVELGFAGNRFSFNVLRLATDLYRVHVGASGEDAAIDVTVDRVTPFESRIVIAGTAHRVQSMVNAATHIVEVGGETYRIGHDEGGVIRAPAPSVVSAVLVSPGDVVSPGDPLAVIEAMKMETTIASELAGTVREIVVRDNDRVAAGEPLLVIDPDGSDTGMGGGAVDFDPLVNTRPARHDSCREHLRRIRRLLLGYDITAGSLEESRPPAGLAACPVDPEHEDIRGLEDGILEIFTDGLALFRRRPRDGATEHHRSSEGYFFDYLRRVGDRGKGLPERFLDELRRTLADYGVSDLEPSPALRSALYRITVSHDRIDRQIQPVLEVLEDRIERIGESPSPGFRRLIDRLALETRHRYPAIHDLVVELRYRAFDLPFLDRVRSATYAEAGRRLDDLVADPGRIDRDEIVAWLVGCPQPLSNEVCRRIVDASPRAQRALLEVLARRYYRERDLAPVAGVDLPDAPIVRSRYPHDDATIELVAAHARYERLDECVAAVREVVAGLDPGHDVVLDLFVAHDGHMPPATARKELAAALDAGLGDLGLRRIVTVMSDPDGTSAGLTFTFRPASDACYREEPLYRDLHPMIAKRLEVRRLANFDIQRLPTTEDVYLFFGRGRDNTRDERLFGLAEVRDLTPVRDDDGRITGFPELERIFRDVLGAIRRVQSRRPAGRRLAWNRVLLYVWPVVDIGPDEMVDMIYRLAPETEELGIEKVAIHARLASGLDVDPATVDRRVIEISNPTGRDIHIDLREHHDRALEPLSEYDQKVARLRQRGLTYPYEIVRLIAPTDANARFRRGEFIEYDLDETGLNPVDRPWGRNTCNIVVGLIRSFSDRYPEGIERVILLSDPTRGMGNLSEPECARIIAALDLAEERAVPVEWFTVSAGALISMESGTENMDWIARVLRRIVEFTQGGGEVNVVVVGVNVGAQPYWNAEATMLVHTSGILVMTPDASMVLTGKDALDFSGGVSAEDNAGIGGYERIMGPNGQAQYWADDLGDACRILLDYYDHAYVAPGERFPRPAPTGDPHDRDITDEPHGGEFETVGDVFSGDGNLDRKRPFDIRRVMGAVIDADHPPLERWYGMKDAEVAVVWDAHLGGRPVCLLGFESRPLPRSGFVPQDGPEVWTSGTLFPQASKKVARAINAASGSRPLVIVANLSGFDGSPESMRNLQLEYGAEIGRAVVNFDGPIVFCVVSRYHGGAFVVFSAALNDSMEVAAVEGSRASVIGGAPAAGVVFAGEVTRRAAGDPRVKELEEAVASAEGPGRSRLLRRLEALREEVRAEKLGEVADEFDAIHDMDRARRMGSVDHIIPPDRLRPYLIEAVERGIRRVLDGSGREA